MNVSVTTVDVTTQKLNSMYGYIHNHASMGVVVVVMAHRVERHFYNKKKYFTGEVRPL
jgi:hypothetical protein